MRIRAIVAACGAASAVFSLSAASSPAEMQYDLVINLKTAKTLGLTLLESLSLRATVVE